MKIEKKWVGKSDLKENKRSNELTKFISRWNSGIDIVLSKPYEYTNGPVIQTTLSKN